MPRKEPAKAEADGDEKVDVEFKGITYHMPRDIGDLPVDYMAAVDDKRWGHAIRFLLGEEYRLFELAGCTVKDAFALMEAHEVALGLRQGESSASSA